MSVEASQQRVRVTPDQSWWAVQHGVESSVATRHAEMQLGYTNQGALIAEACNISTRVHGGLANHGAA